MRLLLANYTHDDPTLERQWAGPDVTVDVHRWPDGGPLPIEAVRAADGIVTYSANAPITLPLEEFRRARVIVRSGVGFDNLDGKAWGAMGVPVMNVPDYGTSEVADHAIALMLALTRGIATYHEQIRDGGWSWGAAPLVLRLREAVFGVVGLGRIGLAAANRARAFGMRVMFYDPYQPAGFDLATGFARAPSLAALMADSDVLSVHCPLTAETRGLISADALAAAKPGLVLVNTARGPVVDLDALAAALRSGRVGGAALDVLPTEPADPGHPLIAAWRAREPWLEGRLTISPHAAFYSPASVIDLRRKSVETALGFLRTGDLARCVNRGHLGPLRPVA